MWIDNVKVFGLPESIVASALPKTEEYNEDVFKMDTVITDEAYKAFKCEGNPLPKTHFDRAKSLSKCKLGTGHDNFLCGIIVQMNVTAPRYWWPEAQRYHFIDIVSSTSTMHKLAAFIEKYTKALNEERLDECERLRRKHFSNNTDPRVFSAFMEFAYNWKTKWNGDMDILKANLPEGYEQTARMTTNYRQLRTIYEQRHNHPLNEWKVFCGWIKRLPLADEFILGGTKEMEQER